MWAPVLRPSELLTHPQVEANNFMPSVTAHDGSDYRIVLGPAHFSGHATAPPGPAPELGQHTEEVLLEAGLDWDADHHPTRRQADWADRPHFWSSSTRPQVRAVTRRWCSPRTRATPSADARSARQADRPPAPGTSPRPISGSAICVSAAATAHR